MDRGQSTHTGVCRGKPSGDQQSQQRLAFCVCISWSRRVGAPSLLDCSCLVPLAVVATLHQVQYDFHNLLFTPPPPPPRTSLSGLCRCRGLDWAMKQFVLISKCFCSRESYCLWKCKWPITNCLPTDRTNSCGLFASLSICIVWYHSILSLQDLCSLHRVDKLNR